MKIGACDAVSPLKNVLRESLVLLVITDDMLRCSRSYKCTAGERQQVSKMRTFSPSYTDVGNR